jgi:hypothetical protein
MFQKLAEAYEVLRDRLSSINYPLFIPYILVG